MENCIFCKIIEGKIPAEKVYEDKKVIAFLDIAPLHKGHTLVIPKKHYETLMDADDLILCELIKVVKKLSIAIMKTTKAHGLNIGINNYKAAGQLVPHFHVHIMPRFEEDGFKHWQGKKISESEMHEISEAIRKAL